MQLKSLLQDPISPPPWCRWIRDLVPPTYPPTASFYGRKVAAFTGFEGPIISDRNPALKNHNGGLPRNAVSSGFVFSPLSVRWTCSSRQMRFLQLANVNFECRSANQAPLWCECDLEYQQQQKREKRRQWAKLIWKSILWCKIISHGHSVYFPVCTVWVIERGLRGRERPHTQKSPTWQYNHLPKLQRGRRVHFKLVNIELDSRLHRKCLSMSKGTDVAASERLEITSKKTKRCQNTFLLGADQSIGKCPVGNKSPCFRLRRGVSEIVAQAAQTFPNFILQFQHFLACLTTVPCESGF